MSSETSTDPTRRGPVAAGRPLPQRAPSRCFPLLAAATALMFTWTLLMIARASYQDTMGLIQKVFELYLAREQ
jgi:hypothetical protein